MCAYFQALLWCRRRCKMARFAWLPDIFCIVIYHCYYYFFYKQNCFPTTLKNRAWENNQPFGSTKKTKKCTGNKKEVKYFWLTGGYDKCVRLVVRNLGGREILEKTFVERFGGCRAGEALQGIPNDPPSQNRLGVQRGLLSHALNHSCCTVFWALQLFWK